MCDACSLEEIFHVEPSEHPQRTPQLGSTPETKLGVDERLVSHPLVHFGDGRKPGCCGRRQTTTTPIVPEASARYRLLAKAEPPHHGRRRPQSEHEHFAVHLETLA